MINNETLNLVSGFKLREEYFDHHGKLHGIQHTYRVMCHCLVLGSILNFERETRLSLCGAFIHDMARRHDGSCYQHGQWASESKYPQFFSLFESIGITESDSEEIRFAVTWHSLPDEINLDHAFRKTAALLKDADVLDRIRLGEGDLKVERLRFPATVELLEYGKSLYLKTAHSKPIIFQDYLLIASEILDGIDTPIKNLPLVHQTRP